MTHLCIVYVCANRQRSHGLVTNPNFGEIVLTQNSESQTQSILKLVNHRSVFGNEAKPCRPFRPPLPPVSLSQLFHLHCDFCEVENNSTHYNDFWSEFTARNEP